MDSNHCPKIRTYTVKKSQWFLSVQQCKDVYIHKKKSKKQNSTLSLWKNLLYIAIQLLDIKRLGHWAVLKVQFCLAVTVPGYDGPPVIIKNRGFWWAQKFFTCSRANRSSQTHVPRTVRWNNLWYTLDKGPKVTTPKIPCGLNITKRRKKKQNKTKKTLFPCLAEWIL